MTGAMRKSQLSIIILNVLLANTNCFANALMVDGYEVPKGFESAFANNELNVEVYLGGKVIGDALLSIQDSTMRLKSTNSLDLADIKPAFQPLLESLLDNPIDKQGVMCTYEVSTTYECKVGQKILGIEYDASALKSTLFVNKKWIEMENSDSVEKNKLQRSSFADASATLQQNLNFSNNDSVNYNARANLSIGEQQVHFSGSAYKSYGLSDNELQSAYWLNDYDGKHITLGYRSAWDNSEYIGSSSAFFPSKELLGLSYGTSRRTISTLSEESDVPIDIFMPSTGKVEVHRDGRLINTQILDAGLQRLDTSNFPYGVYDIEVVIYDGVSKVDTQSHTVYKKSNSLGRLEYNFWAGTSKKKNYSSIDSSDDDDLNIGFTIKQPINGSVDFNSGGYLFTDTSALDLGLTSVFSNDLSFQAGMLYTHKGSYGFDSRLSMNLLGVNNSFNYVKFAANSEEDRTTFRSDTSRLNYSGSFSLYGGHDVAFNVDQDWNNDLTRTALRYGKYFHVNTHDYIRFELSLSKEWKKDNLSNTVAFTSVSYSFGNNDANATVSASAYGNGHYQGETSVDYRVSEHDALRTISGRINKSDEDLNAFIGGNFNSRVLGGHISGQYNNRGKGKNSSTLFGSLQSTVGANSNGIAMSGTTSEAGLIIDTNELGRENLVTVVNSQRYVMSEGDNFVPLLPYQNNHVYFDVLGHDEQSFKYDNNSYVYTAYPGNVGYKKVDVVEAIEVVGQLRNEQGDIIPQTILNNHIGTAITDTNGMFSALISKGDPTLHVEDELYSCDFDLKNKILEQGNRGFVFAGDLVCRANQPLVKLEATNVYY